MVQNEGIRAKVREKLRRLDRSRRTSRDRSNDVNSGSSIRIQANAELEASGVLNAQNAFPGYNTMGFTPTNNTGDESASASDEQIQRRINMRTLPAAIPVNTSESNLLVHDSTIVQSLAEPDSMDLWSVAYREAVESFGEDIDVAILEGRNVEQLFQKLEEIDKQATQESAFLRGVRYLHSIQVPLDRLKLALDLASPLANFNPAANAAVGVVKGVTAIAISFAAADLEFAQQIGDMLEQISYIDDCDTLGQKSSRNDIHKALVMVYKKILEFYKVAYQTLTRKGSRLVMRIVLENSRLPAVVQDFLKEAEKLRKLIEKVTWEIVQDIKDMLYDQEISRWLGSERIRRQQVHHNDLKYLKADEACAFLLQESEFLEWYRAPNSKQLAILGDVGTGKSCAMAFLVDELSRRNASELPRPKLCYHYCQDNEAGRALDIYCCLILALLQQFEGLKRPFCQWYKDAQASGTYDPSRSLDKLESFLQRILEALDRPLFIVIDGLDECDDTSRSTLLEFLQGTSRMAHRVKVILSCRPQDEIIKELGDMSKIYLRSNTERDRVIAQKTVETHLRKLSKEAQALVVESLSRSAHGSAIWTKMMAELIQSQGIRALSPMRRFLENSPLPDKLSELYLTLLSKHTMMNSENEKLASIALNILATARRPLSILELAWAVTLGSAPQEVTTIAALSELVDHERIMSLIQPFIARIDFNDLNKRQIRLVHQSVKEFTINSLKATRFLMQSQYVSNEGEAHKDQDKEDLEAGLLNICIRYLLLDEVGQIDIFSEQEMAMDELPKDIDIFEDTPEPVEYDPHCTWEVWEENMIRYDPTSRGLGELFVYASCHWLDHFGTITVGPLPKLGSIEKLCQAGSVRLQNWIKQNCRPNCVIQARFEFDSSLYDPLSIASLYGSTAILRSMLSNSSFSKQSFLSEPAMSATDQILQWGDLTRLTVLFFEPKFQHELQTIGFFRLVIKYWFHSDRSSTHWPIVFDLIDHIVDKMVQERWANELLCVAASRGCQPVVERLFDNARRRQDLKGLLLSAYESEEEIFFNNSNCRSIGEAVLGNHVNTVRYLLDVEGIEAHLRYRNSQNENILHLASKVCNPKLFHLLVPRFPEGVLQTDDQGRTALTQVIANSSYSPERHESAKILLLEASPNESNSLSDIRQDALRMAVQIGDLEMCRLLVSVGKANPLSALIRDENGNMALKIDLLEQVENAMPILHLLCSHIEQ